MTVLSVAEREGQVYGLPRAEKLAALGWPDLTEGFHGPLPLPPVEGEVFLCWDMGLQTSGNIWVDIETAQEMTIDVGYADHLHGGRVNPLVQQHAFADRLIVGAGRHTLHLPHERGFRYLQCTFSAPATLHDLWVAEHVYPHDDIIRFRCSDATLNAIWEMAGATGHQCSLYSHVDNARRERQGWGGAYSRQFADLHLFGDLRLSRKTLEDFLDCVDVHGFIPDVFSLHQTVSQVDFRPRPVVSRSPAGITCAMPMTVSWPRGCCTRVRWCWSTTGSNCVRGCSGVPTRRPAGGWSGI